MANPPVNGQRTVNSLMIEIALHLVEPCVLTTLTAAVAAPGVATVAVGSTVGMYSGAQVVVANSDGTNPTILVITAFDPVGLTVTGNFLAAYALGSTLQGGTFPTQQPTDPLFTQGEIIGYISRAQNEFLAKVPCLFQFFAPTAINLGQQFYTAPSTSVELERITLANGTLSGHINLISRQAGIVTATLDTPLPNNANFPFTVAGVSDASFDGQFTGAQVTNLTWSWAQAGPNFTSAGGSLTVPLLTRLYEVTQNELTMQDPQWFFNNPEPVPTAWYEDRSGVYGWGIAGLPQSNFTAEVLASIRGPEFMALTDILLVPGIMCHLIKYKAMQYALDKDGEQRQPMFARYCQQRFDRGIMIVDRYLRGFIDAQSGGQ